MIYCSYPKWRLAKCCLKAAPSHGWMLPGTLASPSPPSSSSSSAGGSGTLRSLQMLCSIAHAIMIRHTLSGVCRISTCVLMLWYLFLLTNTLSSTLGAMCTIDCTDHSREASYLHECSLLLLNYPGCSWKVNETHDEVRSSKGHYCFHNNSAN